MKRQQGFGMLDMVFALALAGTLFVAYAGFMQRQKVEFDTQNYAKRIEHLIDALQRYHYQQKLNDADTIYHFPSELNDIITPEEQFWLNCMVADEQARYCARPDYVPWTTQRIDYIAGEKQVTLKHGLRVIAYAELTFPLSAIAPEYRARWASPLLALPYAKRLANGDVKVSVYDPLLSQLYDEFLQRDGSVPLTDDWDVGGIKR
ncbi:hypothetical protein JCM19233_6798 [Vibrio astriarenae]|nr:hypothetical protein JCM19233_6798 [Vibrio sp. C7]